MDPMPSNTPLRLFHISEQPGIVLFEPRPSPSYFPSIDGDVVFAVSERMLHNYLLPRDCPRVAWYINDNTTNEDKKRFMGSTNTAFVMAVESGWYSKIKETVLYCYEFPVDNFTLLDDCAGYYINYKPVESIAVTRIADCMAELLQHHIELRFVPSLINLAEEVKTSSLNFSLIRMRNAKQ
jgi:hypothetical protein